MIVLWQMAFIFSFSCLTAFTSKGRLCTMFDKGNAMISTVSILLVIMLTIGANPAYIDTSSSVINPESTTVKIKINQKPRLGVKKNFSGIKGKNNPVNAGTIYKKENKKSNSRRGSYYGYNNVHMKTFEQRGHNNNAGDVYTYDDVYRLTNVKINVPDPTVPNPTEFEKEKTFNFDKLDNILSIVETQNEQTVTKTTQINPILNQYENFAGWGLSYDLNGNTTQKGTQHFTYNYRNQIIKAQDQTTEANYKYDALGRRVQKAVTIGSTTKTTNYYYSDNHVIEERDGSDNVLNQYIYGTGIDEIIRMDNYSGATATPYYFHTNGIGSVTAITDANGDIVERVSYDTYGMPTFTDAAGEIVSKSTIGNTLLFQGRRYDSETNLYYFRARYYDPIMGRFLQTDPMGYEDSMNLYQALNQSPINFVDPWGELIYFTGENPQGDFETFKQIFVNIGVPREELDRNLKLIKSGKGRYLIDPKSYIPFAENRDIDKERLNKYRSIYTTNLKKSNRFRTRLEFIFSWLIQHPFPIEFSIDPDAFWSGKKKKTKKSRFLYKIYGRGVCLSPDHDLNLSDGKAIQIVVDPDPKNSLVDGEYYVPIVGHKASFYSKGIPLPLEATIVHEFGHAYGLLKGYKMKKHTSMNAEIAVLLENLYRLRTSLRDYSLRKYH